MKNERFLWGSSKDITARGLFQMLTCNRRGGGPKVFGRPRMHFEGPVCQSCGYDLRSLPGCVCPECGKAFDPNALARNSAQRRAWGIAGTVVAIAVSSAAIWHSLDCTLLILNDSGPCGTTLSSATRSLVSNVPVVLCFANLGLLISQKPSLPHRAARAAVFGGWATWLACIAGLIALGARELLISGVRFISE